MFGAVSVYFLQLIAIQRDMSHYHLKQYNLNNWYCGRIWTTWREHSETQSKDFEQKEFKKTARGKKL